MNEDFFSIVALDESVSLSCIIPFYSSFHIIHVFLRLYLNFYKEQKQKDFEHSNDEIMKLLFLFLLGRYNLISFI
jgi:hypothetical protein